MAASTIALMIWVFLVSISARGWAVSFKLDWWILIVGIAYIVLRLLEWFGIIRRELFTNKAPRV